MKITTHDHPRPLAQGNSKRIYCTYCLANAESVTALDKIACLGAYHD